MTKMYHVSVGTNDYTPYQQDIFASNAAVATRRALEAKQYRSAKRLTIEVALSNHGEYDKAGFKMYNAEGGEVWSPMDKDGRYFRVPRFVRRAQAEERLGIEAQRILDTCPAIEAVRAASKGLVVEVERVHFGDSPVTR